QMVLTRSLAAHPAAETPRAVFPHSSPIPLARAIPPLVVVRFPRTQLAHSIPRWGLTPAPRSRVATITSIFKLRVSLASRIQRGSAQRSRRGHLSPVFAE